MVKIYALKDGLYIETGPKSLANWMLLHFVDIDILALGDGGSWIMRTHPDIFIMSNACISVCNEVTASLWKHRWHGYIVIMLAQY